MSATPCIVISASRRTDIPAFYMQWFMAQIKKGFFEVTNPYNRVKKIIDASCDNIHTIVFWSKNFRPFLESDAGGELKKKGYHLFFNFTVNSQSKLLEPNIPPLKERLAQLEELCFKFTPETINWRFDPVCFYRQHNNTKDNNYTDIENNLTDFARIAEKAGELGISRCITSFTDKYAKIKRRTNYLKKIGANPPELIYPDNAKKIEIISRMENLLTTKKISLFTCCEREIFSQLPESTCVSESACIPGRLLKDIFKGSPVIKRDYGQRSKKGCHCTRSIDIGSYDLHPCFHNCLFCYANPAIDTEMKLKRKSEQNAKLKLSADMIKFQQI